MISRLVRLVDALVGMLAASALVASALMILVNVFNRYIVLGWLRISGESSETMAVIFAFIDGLLSPITATADEVPGLLLVWIAFLGAYLAYRQGRHISFDLIIDAMPSPLRRLTLLFRDASILALQVLLLVQSMRMILIDGETEIETAEIAQGWFMIIIPLSAALMMLALILDSSKRKQGASLSS